MMKKMKLAGLVAGMTMAGAVAVSAAPITVTEYTVANYNAFSGSLITQVVESFEGYTAPQNIANGACFAVGCVSSAGGIGNGSSVFGDGALLAIRNGDNFGRTATEGTNFLDSNDTLGMLWDIAFGGSIFNRIGFSLTDVGDVGATMKITLDDGLVYEYTIAAGAPSGSKRLVVVSFADRTGPVSLSLVNNRKDDGFGIDQFTVGAVPLPAGAVLMLSGLGIFAAARRRKAA